MHEHVLAEQVERKFEDPPCVRGAVELSACDGACDESFERPPSFRNSDGRPEVIERAPGLPVVVGELLDDHSHEFAAGSADGAQERERIIAQTTGVREVDGHPRSTQSTSPTA